MSTPVLKVKTFQIYETHQDKNFEKSCDKCVNDWLIANEITSNNVVSISCSFADARGVEGMICVIHIWYK